MTDCPLAGSAEDRPRPFPMEHCVVGGKSVHPSHKLNLFRGIIYCRICGYKAGSRGGGFLRMLTQPCPKTPASQYGTDNLKMFSEGKLPVYKARTSPSAPDFALEMKSLEEPVSDFGKRLLQDFPSITKSEVRDITFNLLRSAAHAASLSGNATSSSSANKHIRVIQDR